MKNQIKIRYPNHHIKWMKPAHQKSKHAGKPKKSKSKGPMDELPLLPASLPAICRSTPPAAQVELLDAEGFCILRRNQ